VDIDFEKLEGTLFMTRK